MTPQILRLINQLFEAEKKVARSEALQPVQRNLERMRAAGPLRRDYPMFSSPELENIAQLIRSVKLPSAQLRLGEIELELFGEVAK